MPEQLKGFPYKEWKERGVKERDIAEELDWKEVKERDLFTSAKLSFKRDNSVWLLLVWKGEGEEEGVTGKVGAGSIFAWNCHHHGFVL